MTANPGQPVPIRPAHPEDYPRLAAVLEEAERFHRAALPHIFRQPRGLFPPPSLFGQLLHGPGSAIFVAGDEPELTGLVTVRAQPPPRQDILVDRRLAVVDMLAVRSGQRRRGIGTALMRAAHSWAATRNLQQLSLHVWEFNQPAIAFYRSLGYTTSSRTMEISLHQAPGNPPATASPPPGRHPD